MVKKNEDILCGEERTKCEVYSRVVGYLRPVSQWNNGKREEFGDRQEFNFGNKDDNQE